MTNPKPSIVFFGTSKRSVMVLEHLFESGIIPLLIVSTPDRPQGRNLLITPTPVKVLAKKLGIPLIQPEKLKDPEVIATLRDAKADVFVVVAYGKIIPQEIIDIPRRGALNIHASLLPKYRGASPIESAILADDRDTGVSIISIDAEMDHGPIVAEARVPMPSWPPRAEMLGGALVHAGAKLLVDILPAWIEGTITATPQNHSAATLTRKIEKADGEIDLSADPYQNFLKIQAYHSWPTAFFFTERNGKKIRIIVKDAEFKDGVLTIKRIIPEGKKEMDYTSYFPQ